MVLLGGEVSQSIIVGCRLWVWCVSKKPGRRNYKLFGINVSFQSRV